jgi:tetratricopeptide (TPR) repeat protein
MLICAALGLVTLALYLPALHHGFVEYDDQQYVTDNPRVQAGLTWSGLVWAFGFHAGNWHPLAWLSHMLDCQLFGARAWGHHLTSILLHVATTLLLFVVLERMTSLRADASVRQSNTMWRSAAVAALFAWHPLHVESVAWVAERKDVLCAFFWMLTLWFYVRFAELSKVQSPKSKIFYAVTLFSFALCLMAKPMGVTLPFVLLLLDYWPLNRIQNSKFKIQNALRLLLEKVPFLALSVIACALTLQAQQIAIVSTAGLTIAQRAAHTAVAYDHYFWAIFFPHHLAVYYPYVLNIGTGIIVLSAVLLALVTWLALINLRQRPYLVVGWFWFLGTLIPVIGLVQVGDQAWADRYTYIPLIGLSVAFVWLVAETVKNKMILRALTVAGSLTMLAATSVQLSYWKNTWTLFDHANQVTHENYMAVTVLASQLAKQGKLDEAIAMYNTALSYKPTFPETHFFLGNAFDQLGRPDDAVAEYEKALWFKPMQEQTHIFLGIVLGKQKKYPEAISNYLAALRIDPDSAVTHNNLARIYHTQGRLDEAVAHYTAALKIDPNLALAHNNLGILLLQKGSLADGTVQLREALRLNPTNSETQFNLALALNQQAQWSEAVGLFQKTAELHRNDARAHCEFAVALSHLKQTREALSEYAAALLIQPDFADALDGLAWILSTNPDAAFRNGTEAVKMAERANELTGKQDPVKGKILAAAYAETGRFAEAMATVQTAKELATANKQPDLANQCEAMLQCFQHSQPWREQ